MRGQRNTVGSFTESVDNDQGSMANNAGSSQQASSSTILNPLERVSSSMASSAEPSYANAVGHGDRNFNGWHYGEPSSMMHLQNQMNDDRIRTEHGWRSLSNEFAGPSPSLEERQFTPTSSHNSGGINIGSSSRQVTSRPLFSEGSSAVYTSTNFNSNAGCLGSSNNEGHGLGSGASANLYRLGGLEREQATFDAAMRTSSGSSGYISENGGGPASLPGNWGSSCKRMALEGTSGQSYDSGSSNGPQSENDIWHYTPARYGSSDSLNLSTPALNPPNVSPLEQQHSRLRFGIRGQPSDASNSLGVDSRAVSSQRNSGGRLINGPQQESVPLNLSSTRNTRLSSGYLPHQMPRELSYGEYPGQRSSAAAASSSRGHQRQAGSMHFYDQSRTQHPWQMDFNLRVGSSSSCPITGDGATVFLDEANMRRIPRSSTDHLMFGPAAELRNLTPDATNWSMGGGNFNNSVASSTQAGPSSSVPLSNAWNCHLSPFSPNPRRLPEIAPWSLTPPPDSVPEGQVSVLSSTASIAADLLSDSVARSRINSQSRHQAHQRSLALFERHRRSVTLERQNDDLFSTARSLRDLATGADGRQRLISEIRQVLSAMRRGENLQAEADMLLDPWILHGMAEFHDRHGDMRLDVDNMSYEELLELGERIGDVSTGLSERAILKRMKQRKYILTYTEPREDMEPCCVCQEGYADGDDIGTLDCGHDFHTGCIKQWLLQKNICPICKTTALAKEKN